MEMFDLYVTIGVFALMGVAGWLLHLCGEDSYKGVPKKFKWKGPRRMLRP